jgi:hypothetical protein
VTVGVAAARPGGSTWRASAGHGGHAPEGRADRSNSRAWLVIGAVAVLVVVGGVVGTLSARDVAPSAAWTADDGSGIAYAVRLAAEGDADWVGLRSSPSALICAGMTDGPVDIDEGPTSQAEVVGGLSGVGLVIRHDRSWYCLRTVGVLVGYSCATRR